MEKPDEISATLLSPIQQLETMLQANNLLNDVTAAFINKHASSHMEALSYLIHKCAELDCLDSLTFNLLMEHQQFEEWVDCLTEIEYSLPLSKKMITFLFYALPPGYDLGNGSVRRAIALIQQSKFYDINYFSHFFVLSDVLLNPLCQAIYDARLRTFSSYTPDIGPLDAASANNIIECLIPLEREQRYRAFFEFFSRLRFIPCSQKYWVEVNVAEYVTDVLGLYLTQEINEIESAQDYHRVETMIRMLRQRGGDSNIFDCIKYSVASCIENNDYYSARTFDQLMTSIGSALSRPQSDLRDFTENLQASKGYRQILAEARHAHGLHRSAPDLSASVQAQSAEEGMRLDM